MLVLEFRAPQTAFSEKLNTFQFVLIVNKCMDLVSVSTCEYVNTFRWTVGVCQLAKLKGVFWTPFKESLHPPFECPIKPVSFALKLSCRGQIRIQY